MDVEGCFKGCVKHVSWVFESVTGEFKGAFQGSLSRCYKDVLGWVKYFESVLNGHKKDRNLINHLYFAKNCSEWFIIVQSKIVKSGSKSLKRVQRDGEKIIVKYSK